MANKISVITINYNNSAGLEKTIESVLSQSGMNVEYIVIDGGSTDGSVDVIKNYSGKLAFWTSEKDTGIYNAMNKGIATSTGDYLLFLNSGDLFTGADVLKACYECITQNQEVDIFYGDVIVKDDRNNTSYYHGYTKEVSILYFKKNTLNHQACLIKASLFKQFGFYPEEYKVASDYWLLLLSLLERKRFLHIDQALVVYDLSGISSSDSFKEYKSEQLSIWKSLVLSPQYVEAYIAEVENLEEENKRLRQKAAYKLVKLGMGLNSIFQNIKKPFSRI